MGGFPDPVHDVFDFDIGDFITNHYHEKIFVKQLSSDTFHVCVRSISISDGGAYFSIALCDSIGSEISNASMQVGSYFYFKSLTATKGINLTSLGQPNPVETISYVSEVATATTGSSFDLDLPALSRLKAGLRGPLAQGHIELEVESNVDSGWLANNTFLNILSINNNNINGIVYKKDGSGTSTFKGIDSVISDCSVTISGLTVGQTYRISLDFGTYTDGTQKMRLTVNDVKSSVVAFSGSFGTQDLRFFFGNTVHAGWIKTGSLKFIPKPIW